MAEIVVSFVLERLGEVLDQIHLCKDVHQQVERLRNELKRMQCFLKDADAKEEGDMRVHNWVSDIRNVAYDAEDLIDTYILKIESLSKIHFMKRYAFVFQEWKQSCKMMKDLEAIQLKISDISTSRGTYGIKNIGEGTSHANETLLKLRRSSPRGQDSDIVGLEEDIVIIVNQLVKDNQRWAISIVGMGGIGKTTLAKEVYNHAEVRACFDCRAWVYVSQDFKTRDVLGGILKQVTRTTKHFQKFGEEELEEMLYEHLQGTRYLVVVDDIWSTTAWDSMARAFPYCGNGSKVLLTTRNRNVALHADAQSIPHEMRFRSKEDSWKLFCRKALIESIDRECPPELEKIGGEIVEKCDGLPLAIIVLGGLLSRKRRLSEWERVLNTIHSYFARDPNGVSAILALSFYDLPCYLKFCFLYLGLFPEDYVITARKLYRLWIAEGLIPQNGERMEDIAEDYLNELIDRNMVQVAKVSANDRVKHCRIHDLMRDLAISKSRVMNFLEIRRKRNSVPPAKTRHLAVCSSSVDFLENSDPHLRSLLFFQLNNESCVTDLRLICRKFKLVKVLELEGTWLKYGGIPNVIGELFHLKYLGLRRCELQSLPEGIGSLSNLQTLDVAENFDLKTVPNVLWKLKNLRHLYMDASMFGNQLRIDTLRHLQTLSDFRVKDWKETNTINLINLRKLGLRGNFCIEKDKIFNSLSKLLYLQSLFLHTDEDYIFPSLKLSSLRRVIKLQMIGVIRNLPRPDEFPPRLTQLILHQSRLSNDPMKVLKELPFLFVLRLKASSYSGKTLQVSVDGFRQLEFLELELLECLEEFNVEENALPKLRSFQLTLCRHLRMLPEEIKSVTTLSELEIKQMPNRFVERLQGEDYYKIQHVPSITILKVV
ncbi:probable disease resistance RPP8-like protein 2 isoform X2 [Ziziphus jujuba]|uniref:Probable disease resistance RPP8-like protein 2 isoform X2 n=1 Tax=Ziziphus jujuba TaxID=326968 RepID=A0ABM3IEB0_ZIZJJ|nr:probable disease resistance RPP8-like protein 2 isoform X2 [Ziziphus jujuba]XP_060675910.1 probable disease resistance RPP8-like protein 2 isoform X2 [Ziziphus jujuba]